MELLDWSCGHWRYDRGRIVHGSGAGVQGIEEIHLTHDFFNGHVETWEESGKGYWVVGDLQVDRRA